MSMEAYIKTISAEHPELEIVTDSAACQAYIGSNLSRVPVSAPCAIVYPTCVEQVQKIVEKANEEGVALVVRSSQGTETLNGSSLPAAGTQCVAVNLSKMNKIKHIDAKNQTVLIEAGVTYGQLNEALKPYGLYMEHPLLPRAEKSVLASLLDREPTMPAKHHWDVPDPLCCVEMVMGNGALFRTGAAAGPGTVEQMIEKGVGFRQAQGPVWLDLGRVITGAQGTLAIATWASVAVRPIGSIHEMTYVQSDDINAVTGYANAIIRRRLGENVVILNSKGMSKAFGVSCEGSPKWTLVVDVRGYRLFPEQYLENQLADMEDVAREYGVEVLREIPGVSNDTVWDLLNGTSPTGDFWKTRGCDGVFDLFCLSTMDQLEQYTSIAEIAVERCGLKAADLCVYCQPAQMARNCQIEFIISADEAAANKLEEMLGVTLLDMKAFFSRPYGALTETVYERFPDQTAYMPHIKKFFDEKGILNPGRLVYDGGRK